MDNALFNSLADNGVLAVIVGYFFYGFNKNFGRLIDWLMTWTVKVDMVVTVKQKEHSEKERTDYN